MVTLFLDAGFALVLLGAGLLYEIWSNGDRWMRRASSFSLAPAMLVFAAGAITLSWAAFVLGEILLPH